MTVRRSARGLLAVAATAVGFAAADTYVVVLALPDMMSTVGLSIDQLQRAAPIISGFLLGYVAMLPLVGKIADLRGRVPVLVGSLGVFAVGSLVTASAYDLHSMVVGRFLQGAGGGGLVPATLALVADRWPAQRRGVPLGVVGAVQEFGAVAGPLYGAVVLALSVWQTIFWVNLVASVLLVLALLLAEKSEPRRHAAQTREVLTSRPVDVAGMVLGGLAVVALALVLIEPSVLTTGLTTGLAFIPYAGETRWSTAVAFTCYALTAAFVVRETTAQRPLIRLRGLPGLARSADAAGAVLLGLGLAGIVLAFSTADPQVQVISPWGPWFLAGSAVAFVGFWWRHRRTTEGLVPRGTFSRGPAWGSVVVSLFVGAALIAALVDIPVFARITVFPDSQIKAALVLVRLLAAVPVGALLGGWCLRRVDAAWVSAAGMALSAVCFWRMSVWGADSLQHPVVTVPLVLCGLGFGLSIAPVNAALLAATRQRVHGLASALLVVARMVGMLVGLSVLTAVGLRQFYAAAAAAPSVAQVCGSDTMCPGYIDVLKQAGVAQVQAVFAGAAICAAIAAVLSAVLLRTRPESRSTTGRAAA